MLTQAITNQLIKFYGFRNSLQVNSNNQHLSNFIQTQTKIGWNHFIRGRVANNIRHVLYEHYGHKPPTKHFDISTWTGKLCLTLIKQHIATWKEYCTPTQLCDHTRQAYKTQIETLRDKSTTRALPHTTKQWFQITTEDINHMSQSQLDQWILHAKKILKNKHLTTQPIITSFF